MRLHVHVLLGYFITNVGMDVYDAYDAFICTYLCDEMEHLCCIIN